MLKVDPREYFTASTKADIESSILLHEALIEGHHTGTLFDLYENHQTNIDDQHEKDCTSCEGRLNEKYHEYHVAYYEDVVGKH